MVLRPLRRAVTLAAAGVIAFAGVASADVVRADGDVVSPTVETFIDLGEVAPSALISVDVGFVLGCASINHPDPGQTVTLAWLTGSHPVGGAIVSVTEGTVGPVPADWTADGEGCASPAPTVVGGTNSTVTVRAPSTPGTGYPYSIIYFKALSPAGNGDGTAFGTSSTAISFSLDVVANTPPVLTLPSDLTVEGDTTGGWTATYGIDATDAEDAPDPTPTCLPAAGAVLPLGTTTVSCSVTDSGGLSDSGTFDVTVVDTTAPALSMPDDLSLTTADPAGATLGDDLPAAVDIVDPVASVGCDPGPGSTVPVGMTTVICTATDATGNRASGSYDVTVRYVPIHVATATWGEPVGDGATFGANRGRTVPVKVSLAVDGAPRTTGSANLRLTPCGADGPVAIQSLTPGGGRWNASLETSTLSASCYRVAAWIDSLQAGHFVLDLRGADAVKTGIGKPKK
ncbi:MAG TPA: HYR domain-containing protein [Candidatus Saccharimonadales bacterium]|nr:HYR domain-containing protein [Candidatus Saccharimonadales bacterium]